MERDNINIEEQAKHFIRNFGVYSFEVIKKCRTRGDHIISTFNYDLFNKVEEILEKKIAEL